MKTSTVSLRLKHVSMAQLKFAKETIQYFTMTACFAVTVPFFVLHYQNDVLEGFSRVLVINFLNP